MKPTELDLDAVADRKVTPPDPPMHLFFVEDRDRWGYSWNVVRAASAEEARKLVGRGSKKMEVSPLPLDGPAAILWSHDESPDTVR